MVMDTHHLPMVVWTVMIQMHRFIQTRTKSAMERTTIAMVILMIMQLTKIIIMKIVTMTDLGVNASITSACETPAGYSSNNDDCNDGDANINPDQSEVCDNEDNDCDGDIDDADNDVIGSSLELYVDSDNDGYGSNTMQLACFASNGLVFNSNDCDDDNNNINPDANEVCDGGIDNDCDGDVDDDDSSTLNSSKSTFYEDIDGDGGAGSEVLACEVGGYSTTNTDCDENDASVRIIGF